MGLETIGYDRLDLVFKFLKFQIDVQGSSKNSIEINIFLLLYKYHRLLPGEILEYIGWKNNGKERKGNYYTRYLNNLRNQGLINKDAKYYVLTDEGRRLLDLLILGYDSNNLSKQSLVESSKIPLEALIFIKLYENRAFSPQHAISLSEEETQLILDQLHEKVFLRSKNDSNSIYLTSHGKSYAKRLIELYN